MMYVIIINIFDDFVKYIWKLVETKKRERKREGEGKSWNKDISFFDLEREVGIELKLKEDQSFFTEINK